jgi:A/G-specific adenine glycosylase
MYFCTFCDSKIHNSLRMNPFFTKTLLHWHDTHPRSMPWSGEKNPYRIWLSEIILQQTRVEQGLPYYNKFIETYPTVSDLADAPEDAVMRLWQGLGYYSRARNLHDAAKHVAQNLKGCFPNDYDELLKLKGVGTYTAAAIASFAFDLPHAVLDGNVYRVLSRFFGIETPIDDPLAKNIFTKLAHELLDETQPARYNQAIMNFGAMQCVPQSPNCVICPMRENCQAFATKRVNELPIKSKKIDKTFRFFNYLFIKEGNEIWLHKRVEKDIWQNLYEFPMIETNKLLENESELISYIKSDERDLFDENSLQNIEIVQKSPVFKQILTHRKVIAIFWVVNICTKKMSKKTNFFKTGTENLITFALPKVISDYLNNGQLSML